MAGTERHALTHTGRRLCLVVFEHPFDKAKAARPWWTKREREVTCAMCWGAINWCEWRGVRTKRGRFGRFSGKSISIILKTEGQAANGLETSGDVAE
jgi:hypothetical protein